MSSIKADLSIRFSLAYTDLIRLHRPYMPAWLTLHLC